MFEDLLNSLNAKPKSYNSSSILSYKIREFDIYDNKIIRSNKSHDMYNCPFCLEVRGKADNDAKFYWSKEKIVGYCFKCHTVGILKSDRDINEVQLESKLRSLLLLDQETPDVDLSSLKEFNYKAFKECDERSRNYVINRCVFYENIIDYLEIRCLTDVGVTLPIYLNNKIISYNLRFFEPKNKMKYYIPEGVKYFYSPNKALNENNKFSEFTLVEGSFSAIGAMLLGYENPLATFGSTITDFQINLLRKFSPYKINLFFDETKLSLGVLSKIKNRFPTVNSFNIIPARMDAEDRLNKILLKKKKQDLIDFVKEVYNRIENLDGQ